MANKSVPNSMVNHLFPEEENWTEHSFVCFGNQHLRPQSFLKENMSITDCRNGTVHVRKERKKRQCPLPRNTEEEFNNSDMGSYSWDHTQLSTRQQRQGLIGYLTRISSCVHIYCHLVIRCSTLDSSRPCSTNNQVSCN